MEKLSFNAFKDLLPVVMTIRTTNLFVVPNDSPVKSVAEFVAQAKGNPNKASYGSYGIASGDGDEIRIGLQLAQEDLAQLLGASRQRVNQELKGFEREGAVRVEPTRLVFTQAGRGEVAFAQGRVYLDGNALTLSPADSNRVAEFERSVRALESRRYRRSWALTITCVSAAGSRSSGMVPTPGPGPTSLPTAKAPIGPLLLGSKAYFEVS